MMWGLNNGEDFIHPKTFIWFKDHNLLEVAWGKGPDLIGGPDYKGMWVVESRPYARINYGAWRYIPDRRLHQHEIIELFRQALNSDELFEYLLIS